MKIIENTKDELIQKEIQTLKEQLADADMINAIDEIIDVLIKNGIDISSFSTNLQNKLELRKMLKERLNQLGG